MSRQQLSSIVLAVGMIAAALPTLARADVVFGNLGASGTGALSNTSTEFGPDAGRSLAQGFTAASPNLKVTSIALGLIGTGTVPAYVDIYADVSGQPAASPLSSSSVINVGAKGTYAFSFFDANLTQGSNYWVIPQLEGSWFLNSPGSTPTAQNSSGYIYTSTLERLTFGSWQEAPSNRYGISVTASPIPEIDPAGFGSVAALITGTLGLIERRRLKPKAA